MNGDSSEISPQPLDYVLNLQPGSHAIFCYDKQEEAAQVFNSYLQGGLERREAVHLVAPKNETYASFLRDADVDIESLEKDRRLGCTLISDGCVDLGRLSGPKASQTIMKLAQEDHDLGFKGSRIITLKEHYLEYATPSDLLQYEREIKRAYNARTQNLPTSGICMYRARRLVDLGLHELLMNLFQPHDQIIGKGLAWAKD